MAMAARFMRGKPVAVVAELGAPIGIGAPGRAFQDETAAVLDGHGDIAVEIGAERRAAPLAFEQDEGREEGQVETVVVDQRGLESAVGEEQTAIELRQAVAVFGAVNFSHGLGSSIGGGAGGAWMPGKCDRQLAFASELVVQCGYPAFRWAGHG